MLHLQMTIEELKKSLLGREYTEPVKINIAAVVTDHQQFLKISFLVVENWKKDINRCPEYLRLIEFYEAVNKE